MAKIIVDEAKCVGCGLCVNMCPDCFELVESGVVKVKNSTCGDCDLNDIASQCPVEAITVGD